MGQPLVSIIVPVYNLIEYLDRCVESLKSQTYREIEIILVDDGSTDGSGAMCDAYAQKDSRIKAIHKENGGLVSAWKCGLKESKGRYVSFVDGDDWIDTGMIEDMLRYTSAEEGEVISCDYLIEQPDGSRAVYQGLKPGEYGREQLEREVFPQLLGNENRMVCLSRCMKLISRELMEENAHYSDEKLRMGEDVAAILPVLLDCSRLVILDRKAYYHYYYNPASMVHKYDKGLAGNILQLKEVIDRVLKEKGVPELQGSADRECIFLFFLILKNEARGNPKEYDKKIREFCSQENNRRLIRQTPVTVRSNANKLLYMVMKHPNRLMTVLLRMAMCWYYRE